MTSEQAIKMLRVIKRTVFLGNRKFYEALDKAIDALREQPETHEEHTKTNACDCISRQDAISMVHTALFPKIGLAKKAGDSLMQLPSVQPEIIRCRYCRHWDKTWSNNWSPDYHYCPVIDEVRKGNFHCRYAERRIDE